MDGILGLLRIRVIKGINLAVRDTVSSDPYVVLTMKDQDMSMLMLLSLRGFWYVLVEFVEGNHGLDQSVSVRRIGLFGFSRDWLFPEKDRPDWKFLAQNSSSLRLYTIYSTSFRCRNLEMGVASKLKTHVVKNNINPEWNDDLTLSMKTLDEPITLTVYDKDTFTGDDKMGEATIDIQPYIKALRMGMTNLPNGCALARIQPNEHNCLADESSVVWNNGEVTQQMRLALKNVECGELVVQLLWIECPGCKGLGTSSKGSPLHNREFSFSEMLIHFRCSDLLQAESV
ncbi:hypothetical protein ACFE04_029528 [Oxalis oulophora]